jgi:D-xylose transport system permease protein
MSLTTPTRDPRLMVEEGGVGGLLAAARRRITGGELGSIPVVVALIIIWIYLQSQNSNFLSAGNVTNLMLQVAAVGTISVGIVTVLLLGEIDLSVGYVSGFTSAIMAVQIVKHGWNPALAVVLAIAVGALIGAFQGSMFALFNVPSFVVTLAGLIAWQGMLINELGQTGTVNLQYGNGVNRLTSTFFSPAVGYIIAAVVVALYLFSAFSTYGRQRAAGLETDSIALVGVRAVVIAAIGFFLVYWLNRDRGLPLAVVIFVGFVILFDLMFRHSHYGRHIFAVGGNVEAARRAGINVTFIRITAFTICSAMAAAGGVLAAARLTAVNQSSGGGDVLLNSIAAAVIGGTSLFGGRGSSYSSLLGVLVIGSIANGLDLLNKSSATKFVITGLVLLVAATIDALGRRGRERTGKA